MRVLRLPTDIVEDEISEEIETELDGLSPEYMACDVLASGADVELEGCIPKSEVKSGKSSAISLTK